MEFISYSRRDDVFAHRLTEHLKAAGRDIWIDWEDIPPTADWWQEISTGIERADSFIFIISPDSVHSEVCNKEIEYAVSNNKRFVPLLHRDLVDEDDKNALHPTISSHNWIFFRETDSFEGAIEKLIAALDTDLDHVSDHTRLLLRAIEWDQKGRDSSLLITGNELLRAESWLSANINKRPEPTDLHSAFIYESRRRESQRARILLTGVTVALVIAVTLTIVSLVLFGVADQERIRAENNQATAVYAQGIAELRGNQAASLALAANARNQINEKNPNLALALALAAYNANQPPLADVQRTLADTIYAPGADARLGGHDASIIEVALSLSGKKAVSLSVEGTLIYWDITTGNPIRTIDLGGPVTAADLHPDGVTALTGMYDGTILLWNLETGEQRGVLAGHEGLITSALFSPNGSDVLSAAADHTMRLWDMNTEAEKLRIESVGIILKLDFDARGTRAVSGAGDSNVLNVNAEGNRRDRSVQVWDLRTGESLYRFNPSQSDPDAGFVRAVAFSPDGRTVLSGTWSQTRGGQLQLWDLQSQGLRTVFYGPTDIIADVDFSPDNNFVLGVSWDGSLRIWQIASGLEVQRFQGHDDRVLSMSVGADGFSILTSTGNVGNTLPNPANDQASDHSVWLWNLRNRATILALAGHRDWVWGADYSPDGRFAASGSGPLQAPYTDTSVRLWSLETGTQTDLLLWHTRTVSGVAFSPDGRQLASASWDGTLRLWRLEEEDRQLVGIPDRVLVNTTLEGDGIIMVRLNSVTYSPDGTRVLSALSDGTVRAWDVATGQEVLRLSGHISGVNSAVFSPDGQFILSGSDDQTLRLWDVNTGQEIRQFVGHNDRVNGVAFSPDGTQAASTSWNPIVRLWDVATGQEIHQLVGHANAVFGVDFSGDGTRLLTGSADQTLRLWDATTGQEIRQLTGHTNWILSVKFSPDDSTALSAAEDNTLRLWRVESLDRLIAWGEGHRYIPNLSCAEREQYNVEPLCDVEGNLPTPTVTPTPQPTHTPTPAPG